MRKVDQKVTSGGSMMRVLGVIASGLMLFGVGLVFRQHDRLVPAWLTFTVLLLPVAALVAGRALPSAKRQATRQKLDEWLVRHGDGIDALPESSVALWIALAAGAGLFLELMMIRLHASFFQLFAYFKNVSLLSCFLGLGVGYTLAERRRLGTPLVLPLLALQISLLYVLRLVGSQDLLQNPVVEEFTLGMNHVDEWLDVVTVYGFVIFVFALNALTFVPLGQLAGRLMRRRPNLPAYSANLLGSLAGIAVFYGLALLWTPPAVWLMVGALALVPFLRQEVSTLVPSTVATVIVLAILATSPRLNRLDTYSPYQILTLITRGGSLPELQVNNVYFQRLVDLRDEGSRARLPHYELPYELHPNPRRVLIVGGGTGNDVAAAVRRGAESVDVVEIDPAILQYGRLLHPMKPYQEPNVRAIVNDARAYIRHTDEVYDLIVYGLLDSHTLLSGMSGVRLDSYVYTVEAFREARSRLAPGGLIVMTFSVSSPQMSLKLDRMLETAFDGERPLALTLSIGTAYVIGENQGMRTLDIPAGFKAMSYGDGADQNSERVDISTDDWPFLYMVRRKYPTTYVAMLLLLLLVSFLFLRDLAPRSRGMYSLPCFFLGAGFMLVETKAITELALVWGSTWFVVGLTIAGILIMAFAANVVVQRRGIPPIWLTYGGLALALVAGLVLSRGVVEALPPISGGIAATMLLTLPLFFSGLAFSSELGRATSAAVPLSSNLLGAMLGGFLEYNAMYFGLRSLYLLALVLYFLAWFTSRRSADYQSVPARR